MANYTESVVTQLRRKNTTGFDTPFSIGSAAEYILGVRGTSVNNVEENLLLGFDCITTEEQLDNGITHIIKEFRTEETVEKYYLLDIYEYSNYSTGERWFFEETLFLPADETDNKYDANLEELNALNDNGNIYSMLDDNEEFNMVNNEAPKQPVISRATLKFVVAEGAEPVDVAQKITYAQYPVEGKKIQKTVIRNLL